MVKLCYCLELTKPCRVRTVLSSDPSRARRSPSRSQTSSRPVLRSPCPVAGLTGHCPVHRGPCPGYPARCLSPLRVASRAIVTPRRPEPADVAFVAVVLSRVKLFPSPHPTKNRLSDCCRFQLRGIHFFGDISHTVRWIGMIFWNKQF